MSEKPKAGAGEFNCFCGQVHPLSMLGRSGVHPAPVTRPDLDALTTGELIEWTKGWPMVRENSERGKWVRSTLRALAAERARADQAEQRLANAPHDTECEVNRTEPSDHSYDDWCDCWKSAASTAEPQ